MSRLFDDDDFESVPLDLDDDSLNTGADNVSGAVSDDTQKYGPVATGGGQAAMPDRTVSDYTRTYTPVGSAGSLEDANGAEDFDKEYISRSAPRSGQRPGSYSGRKGGYDDFDNFDDGQDDFESGKKSDRYAPRKKKRGHGGLIAIIIIIIAAAVAAVVYIAFFRNNGGTAPVESTEESSTQEPGVWQKNPDTEISALVSQYYTALKNVDMTTLQTIVDSSVTLNESNIAATSQYIEEYQNIDTYVADGENAGEYALYVAYDIKFIGIDTVAPGLTPAYITTGTDGAMKLIPYENFSDTIKQYMTSVSGDQTIIDLRSTVTSNYDAAIAADPVLAQFVTDLGNGTATVPETTAAAAETEASAEGGDYTEPNTGMVFTGTDATKYTNDTVRCRTSPDTSGEDNIYVVLDPGTQVQVVGTSGEWSRIYLLTDAQELYCMSQFLSDTP